MRRSVTSSYCKSTPPEVMTISDLAEYLQVSMPSLYGLVQQGNVPGRKVVKH